MTTSCLQGQCYAYYCAIQVPCMVLCYESINMFPSSCISGNGTDCKAPSQLQDLEAERVAEETEAQQQGKAAQAKKRKAHSDTVPLATKKPKMVSVQQLHTTSTAGNPIQTAQHSRSARQSCSATSGKHFRVNSSSIEAGSQANHKSIDENHSDEASSPRAKPSSINSGDPSAQQASRTEKQLHANPKAASDKPKPALSATASQGQAAAQPESKTQNMLTSVKEYFVKWKGKSFLHCSWVRHDDVLKVARLSPGLNMRFKNYQRSVYGMPQVSTSACLCSIPVNQGCKVS